MPGTCIIKFDCVPIVVPMAREQCTLFKVHLFEKYVIANNECLELVKQLVLDALWGLVPLLITKVATSGKIASYEIALFYSRMYKMGFIMSASLFGILGNVCTCAATFACTFVSRLFIIDARNMHY